MSILITFADGNPDTIRRFAYFIADNLERDRQLRRRPRSLFARLRAALIPDRSVFDQEVGVAFRYPWSKPSDPGL
jgi:hypothetical protein